MVLEATNNTTPARPDVAAAALDRLTLSDNNSDEIILPKESRSKETHSLESEDLVVVEGTVGIIAGPAANNAAAREALRALQAAAAEINNSSSIALAATPPSSPSKRHPQFSSKSNGALKSATSPLKNAPQMMDSMTVATTPQITNIEEEEEEEDDEEEIGEEEEESSEISASDEDGTWISWFCSIRGNEFFVEVDEEYIQDDFNLTGLNLIVPYYDYALDMVLDVEMPMEEQLTEDQQEIVESAAEMLYGMIHARYILTNRGMHAMYEKYRAALFGRCPRVFCQGQPVLPVGLSDLPRGYSVNVFCPRCHGLFFPKSTRQANIDGAYFGTTFPHLYLMTHADMIPPKPAQQYVPRVYGFRIHHSSLYFKNQLDEEQQKEQRPKRIKNIRAGRMK